MSVFVIAGADSNDNLSYEAHKRVLDVLKAYPRPFHATADRSQAAFDNSDIYIGLYGLDYRPEYRAAFDRAIEQKKTCFIFARAESRGTAKRHPLLQSFFDYARKHYARKHSTATDNVIADYQDIADLTCQLTAALENLTKKFLPEWRPPRLPLHNNLFMGRAMALQEVADLLEEHSTLAIITGIGGTGQTALAQELIYDRREAFPGGVFWLDTFGPDGKDPAPALRKLAGTHPEGRAFLDGKDIVTPEMVKTWLQSAEGDVLIVADDIWHEEPLKALQHAIPESSSFQCKLVVTTRNEDILIQWQWTRYALLELEPIEGLMVLRAALKLPLRLDDDTLEQLQAISTCLAGHALSLQLAAKWMLLNDGAEAIPLYINAHKNAPNLLAELDLEQNPHIETFEKAFTLTYLSLSPDEQMLFRGTGAFAPASEFTADALLQVCGINQHNPEYETLRQTIHPLVPAFLSVDETTGRYRTHILLWDYARALMTHSQEIPHARLRQMRYYMEQATYWIGERYEIAPLEADLSQYNHAFAWARNHASPWLMPFVLAAGELLYLKKLYSDLHTWLDAVIKAGIDAGDRNEQAGQLRSLGDLSVRAEHLQAGRTYYERAGILYHQIGSLSGQAHVLKALGDLCTRMELLEKAREYYDRTVLLYTRIDFKLGQANTLKALGDLSIQSGDHRAAGDYYQQALDAYSQIDFLPGEAHVLKALGDLLARENQLPKAREHYLLALPIYKELGFHENRADTLYALGTLCLEVQEFSNAQAFYRQAQEAYNELHSPDGEAQSLLALGGIARRQDNLRESADSYHQALKLYQTIEDREPILEQILTISQALAQAYLDIEDIREAVRCLMDISRMGKIPLETQTQFQHISWQIGSREFERHWKALDAKLEIPGWLKPDVSTPVIITGEVLNTVREFLRVETREEKQKIVAQSGNLLFGEAADSVFDRLVREYPGQDAALRQINQHRTLLKRCQEIGVDKAFAELVDEELEVDKRSRLKQALDSYNEALTRLADIPLVYASVQINRARTLHDLSRLPEEDRLTRLKQVLNAYDEAVKHQRSNPHEYAVTQLQRAAILREVAPLIEENRSSYIRKSLIAYQDALECQRSIPADYARTQNLRAEVLIELGNVPGEDRLACLHQALQAYAESLQRQANMPLDYAHTRHKQAKLLYELAGLPGEDFAKRMREALSAFDDALERQRESPLDYARTQADRVTLLRDMAGLPGEDRAARLYQALAATNEAVSMLRESPLDYARTQVGRAVLLREIAGLSGEHRAARMREALVTYDEVLERLRDVPLDYAQAQMSRAGLLREVAGLPGENRDKRLRQALESAAQSVATLEEMEETVHIRTAHRIIITIRNMSMNGSDGKDSTQFDLWWREIVGKPRPDWLTE